MNRWLQEDQIYNPYDQRRRWMNGDLIVLGGWQISFCSKAHTVRQTIAPKWKHELVHVDCIDKAFKLNTKNEPSCCDFTAECPNNTCHIGIHVTHNMLGYLHCEILLFWWILHRSFAIPLSHTRSCQDTTS